MKKGFTLIELLAVIVILAIILLIAVPQVLDVIEDVKNNSNNSTFSMIEESASIFYQSKLLKNETLSDYIFLEDLVSEGYLDSYPIDFITNEELKGVIKIEEEEDGNCNFSFLEINNTEGEVVLIDDTKTISQIIVEGNTVQEESDTGVNLVPTKYEDWDLGHYEMATGRKEIYPDRILVPYLIPVTPGEVYYFNTNHPNATFIVRAYNSNLSYVWSRGIINNGTMAVQDGEYYYSIAMYNITEEEYPLYFESGDLKPFMTLSTNSHEFVEYIPNLPSAYFPSELKSVSGNLYIDDLIVNIPIMNGLGDNYNDTYNISTGEYVKKVSLDTFDGTEAWVLDGTFPIGCYYTTYFSSWNTAIPYWKTSIANYSSKSLIISNKDFLFTGSGAEYLEFENYNFYTTTEFESHITDLYNEGTPLVVASVLDTYQTSTLVAVSIPADASYIYFDGEVKGNIIVEYVE